MAENNGLNTPFPVPTTKGGTGLTTTGVDSILVTNGAGTPSYSTIIPAATQDNITRLGTIINVAGNFDMSSFKVTNALDPTAAQDLATKNYVDSVAIGLTVKNAAVCATTAALTSVYNNGAAGVGATLTNAGAMAAFSSDGVSPTVNQRVLVKDQALPEENGIYDLTTVGTGAINWVLTRSVDFDTAAEILPGSLVPILPGGTLFGNTSWLEANTVVTVGTDPIQFIQFTASLPISLANGGTGANIVASNGGIFYSTASTGALLAGTATANQVLLSGASAAPSWSTATYPPTTTINRLLYSTANNVIGELATTNRALLSTNATGVPTWLALTDGQLVIGSTAGAPAAASLTAGTGITITPGSNSISIAASAATPPTVQTFLSGSGNYNLPAGCLYIRVVAVGGGGGGSGGANSLNDAGLGGNGGNTTFGADITCNGGTGGHRGGSGGGGAGGTVVLAGPSGIAVTGGTGSGQCGNASIANVGYAGGSGAASALGGQGQGYSGAAIAVAGSANTGGGGGGGYTANLAGSFGGCGGGSGGYCDVIITSPGAIYAYAVGAGGTAGTAGTGGYAGAAGGSGGIWVFEYY